MSAVDVDEILENQLNSNSLSMPYDVYAQLFDSVSALGDENEKLRRLLRDAIRAMWACDSDVCVYGCECGEGIECPTITSCLIEQHARELGVEV